MKIGDKVRFLNDVGGGVITGFQGKDMVLVCGEDGFEIPTLTKDVVVVETDNYNIAKKVQKTSNQPTESPRPTSVKQALSATDEEDTADEEIDLADKEMSYTPMAQERRGADTVNLFLAFTPADKGRPEAGPYEVYLVNDCNYYIRFALTTVTEDVSTLRHEGELAPNTKFFLEEISAECLSEWENAEIRTFCLKREKAFKAKPAYEVSLKIEGRKFFKAGSYSSTPFFSSPALLFEVIKNDRPVRLHPVTAEEIQKAIVLPTRSQPITTARVERPKRNSNQPIVVDLHAANLLDTMVGLTPHDILEYQMKVFRDKMDEHVKQRGKRLIFIHGKGNGILRQTILKELQKHYNSCRVQDASFREFGYGATLVVIA